MPGVPGKQPKKHQSAQVHALRLACIFDSKVSLQNSNPTTKTLHITKILPDFKHHKYGNQKTMNKQINKGSYRQSYKESIKEIHHNLH